MNAPEAAAGRIVAPPSMARLAAEALRAMILGGELQPGEHLVETRLTERLGVSRPPVREALQSLQHDGLVVQHPRRGMVVRQLTRHDVYEIVTLRDGLETLALRLALPLTDPDADLAPVRDALADLERAGEAGTGGATLVELGYAFHLAVVDLARHERLTGTYRSLQLQMQLCMSLNVASRTQESPAGNAARHRSLLEALESGEVDAALAAFAEHGHRSFLAVVEGLDGGTPESDRWLAQRRDAGA
ncbi:GntR family transcriptional regulator [Nocardioides zeae]|uniref:GntR family transcriptional regulator n=1 Tax=Nocardioides imazamoxiresistens TaxID=3231893 RepID=A0ABU3PXV1_9ACTN|nr:GntR family transcriptional regulator [Nocardioides zeae]MDT9594078.1 GntR family transcriptional regulator [Nocardioides zeae]